MSASLKKNLRRISRPHGGRFVSNESVIGEISLNSAGISALSAFADYLTRPSGMVNFLAFSDNRDRDASTGARLRIDITAVGRDIDLVK